MTTSQPFEDLKDWLEVLQRQVADTKKYGKFTEQGQDIVERTDKDRLADSQRFLQEYLKTDPRRAAILDIGSGLGNPNQALAGATAYDLTRDPKISQRAHVIASDIPGERGRWPLKGLDTAEIPTNFRLPINQIIGSRGDYPVWILRAANSIDLLMSPEQTQQHFEDVITQSRGKDVVYLYNKHVLYKSAGSDRFRIIGDLNDAGFAHQGQAWRQNLTRAPYTLRSGGKPTVSTTTLVDMDTVKRPAPMHGQGRTDPASVRVTNPMSRTPQHAQGATDPLSVHVRQPEQPLGERATTALTIRKRENIPAGQDLTITGFKALP